MLHFLRRLVRQQKTTGAVVVRRQLSPHTKLLIVGGLSALVVGAVVFVYDHGLSMAGFESALAARLQQRLNDDVTRLNDENQQLREALARAERARQMDETAYQDLSKSLQGYEQEIVKLREEANFYRNIISPADGKAGLRIQSLDIRPTGVANQYSYKLILVRALKHDRNLSGTASLEISGSQTGQNFVIRVPAANERPLQFSFQYYKDIDGKIELPRGFRPRTVKINVTAGDGQNVEAVFEWPQA